MKKSEKIFIDAYRAKEIKSRLKYAAEMAILLKEPQILIRALYITQFIFESFGTGLIDWIYDITAGRKAVDWEEFEKQIDEILKF